MGHRRMMGRGGADTPWTPAEITLAAWYDFDDASTITLSGSDITAVDDKSGNSIDLISDFTNNPTQGTFNGKNTCVFTAPDCRLGGTIPLATLGQFFAVLDVTKTGGAVFMRSTNVLSRYALTSTQNSSSTIISQEIGTPSYRFNAEASGWVNRGDVYNDLSAGIGIVQIEDINLVNWQNLAYGEYPGADWSGNWAEGIWILGSITIDVQQRIEGYLSWKWSGNGNWLPTGHPYKNSPPTT